jgi:hypothetical protein
LARGALVGFVSDGKPPFLIISKSNGAKKKLKQDPEATMNAHEIITRLESVRAALTAIKNQL